MKTLAEFETLEEAKNYIHTTYRKIGGNEASQILFVMGALDSIEGAQNDVTPIEVIPEVPTTVGSACRTIVRTIEGGQFATDPSVKDGQLNRAATQALVGAGILTQEQADGFFAEAKSKDEDSKPYKNATAHDFAKAKGTCPVKPVTPINGYLKITLTQDVEAHRPQVYAMVQDVKQYLTTFGVVSAAGDYLAQVPRQYSELLIDDYYGVIA